MRNKRFQKYVLFGSGLLFLVSMFGQTMNMVGQISNAQPSNSQPITTQPPSSN